MKKIFVLLLAALALGLSASSPAPGQGAATYLAKCASINGMNEAERTFAFSRMTFKPDYEGAEIAPSCNVYSRNLPRFIVLHNTQGSLEAAIAQFRERGGSSAHYLVDQDGTVIQVVPESLGAYHASCYGRPDTCLPSCPACKNQRGYFREPYTQSIGIELVNLGAVDPQALAGSGLLYEDFNMAFGYRWWQDYPSAQLAALKALVDDIRQRWGISLDDGYILGHSRINHGSDPGPALNLFWSRYGNPPRAPLWSSGK